MNAVFAVPGIGVSRIVLEAANKVVDIAVDDQLKEVAHRYGITPIFAGIFGSRAKVYDGPESDYDIYVPYVGQVAQYVRALDVDTRQIEGKEILPPQINVGVVENGKVINVQLNFVSLDHYIQELTRSNIDFKIALDNVLVRYCSQPALTALKVAAYTYMDLEKIKNMCLGRASKTAGLLKDNKTIKRSEITDGLYRLLYSALTTSKAAERHIYGNRTPSMAELLDAYISYIDEDGLTHTTVHALLTTIRCGKWNDEEQQDVITAAIIGTIERVIPVIRARPIVIPKMHQYGDEQRIEARMKMAKLLNTMFAELLLEANGYKKSD